MQPAEPTSEDIRLRLHEDMPSLKDVMPFWRAKADHPNADPDLFREVVASRRNVISPFVFEIISGGITVALVLARLEHSAVPCSAGYLRLSRRRHQALVFLYQGVVGELTVGAAEKLLEVVRDQMTVRRIKFALLAGLQDGSALQLASHAARKSLLFKTVTHRAMELPERPGAFLERMKSKHRSWVRSRLKLLSTEMPGGVDWRDLSSFPSIPALCATLEAVAKNTYQRALGAGFHDDLEHQQRYIRMSEQGRLRTWVLTKADQPVAFWIGSVWGKTFHSAYTGYLPDFRRYEVGTLILVHAVDALAAEGAKTFDFGLGDATYKERFGDRQWIERTYIQLPPTVTGSLLHLRLRCETAIAGTIRRFLDHNGLLQRMRTAWRRHLTPRGSAHPPTGTAGDKD